MTAATSVVRAVSALRAVGFFAERAGTDTEVAAALVDDYQAMWGHSPSPDDELLDLELLRFDPARVWWEDSEADIGPGSRAYVGDVRLAGPRGGLISGGSALDGQRESKQIRVAEATADLGPLSRRVRCTVGVVIHDQLLECHRDKEEAVLGTGLVVLEQR